MRYSSAIGGLFLVSLVFIAGCGPLMVNMAYRPEGPAQPVLFERRPPLFLAPVTNATDGKVETYQGPFQLTQSAEQTLRDALATELGRLQYPLAETAQQAEGVVEAVVARMAIDLTGTQGLSDLVQAEYSLDVTVKDSRQRALIAKRITGTAKAVRPGFGIPSALYSGMMTSAIGQAMGKLGPFFESQDLLALLEGRRPNRKAVAVEAPAPIRLHSQGKSKKAMVTIIPQGEEAPPQAAPEPPAAPAALPSDIDELPTARFPARQDAYAVVIGVGKYRQKLPPADFADGDARVVARYLTKVLGYQDANVAMLVNNEATKGDFEKYFDQWLPNRVEKDAEVFIYYSGHGAPNPETGDAYLVPHDGDPTYLKQTGYQLKNLYAALSKLPTRHITVVLDSCFSGAGGRSVLAKGARPLVNVRLGGVVPSNIRVLSASAADQISHAYEAQGHGLFTYFLLKGIKEQTGKGSVDMKKVFDSAVPQVSNIARREYNSDQVPQWQESARTTASFRGR